MEAMEKECPQCKSKMFFKPLYENRGLWDCSFCSHKIFFERIDGVYLYDSLINR